jgi:putative endonuclease
MESNHFVYILECSDGTYYTGYTNNVQKRLNVHASGKGAKYTRGRLPVKLVYEKRCENKSDALKEEHKIKKLTKKQKIELINVGGVIHVGSKEL